MGERGGWVPQFWVYVRDRHWAMLERKGVDPPTWVRELVREKLKAEEVFEAMDAVLLHPEASAALERHFRDVLEKELGDGPAGDGENVGGVAGQQRGDEQADRAGEAGGAGGAGEGGEEEGLDGR